MADKEETSLETKRVEEGSVLEGMRSPLANHPWMLSYEDETYPMPPIPSSVDLTRGYLFERSSVFVNHNHVFDSKVIGAYAGEVVDLDVLYVFRTAWPPDTDSSEE